MRGKTIILFALAFYSWTQALRTSEKKCEEYAKLVNKEEEMPVLRFDAKPEKNAEVECGIVETPLIIGGTEARAKEFPHMVAIGFGGGADFVWACGGSVISEEYVLTAAHCVHSHERGAASKVRAGMVNMQTADYDYQERGVAQLIKHPEYKPPIRYNDIALIKVDKPFELNEFVRPVCLDSGPELHGKSAIAIGFGKVNYEDDVGSDHLMKVELNYISKKDCVKSFKIDIGKVQLPAGIVDGMLCAGVMAGGKDTCQGDSGGPLQRVLANPYCMYSIVGITSFGKFCGFSNAPAIYTRVSYYIDWIEKIVWPSL